MAAPAMPPPPVIAPPPEPIPPVLPPPAGSIASDDSKKDKKEKKSHKSDSSKSHKDSKKESKKKHKKTSERKSSTAGETFEEEKRRLAAQYGLDSSDSEEALPPPVVAHDDASALLANASRRKSRPTNDNIGPQARASTLQPSKPNMGMAPFVPPPPKTKGPPPPPAGGPSAPPPPSGGPTAPAAPLSESPPAGFLAARHRTQPQHTSTPELSASATLPRNFGKQMGNNIAAAASHSPQLSPAIPRRTGSARRSSNKANKLVSTASDRPTSRAAVPVKLSKRASVAPGQIAPMPPGGASPVVSRRRDSSKEDKVKDDKAKNEKPIEAATAPLPEEAVLSAQTLAIKKMQEAQKALAERKALEAQQPAVETKQEKKGGFFSRKKKAKNDTLGEEISGPTNVQHRGHVGFDQGGFQTKNLPPQYKHLFSSLESHLAKLGVQGLTAKEQRMVLKMLLKNPDVFKQAGKANIDVADKPAATPKTANNSDASNNDKQSLAISGPKLVSTAPPRPVVTAATPLDALQIVKQQAMRIRELESQLGYELDRNDLMKVDIDDLSAQLAEEQKHREDAEERCQTLEVEVRQLRAVAGGKKLETSGVVEQLKDELDKVNKRLKEEKRSLNKYKKDKSKLELKVASYKAQVKQLKKESSSDTQLNASGQLDISNQNNNNDNNNDVDDDEEEDDDDDVAPTPDPRPKRPPPPLSAGEIDTGLPPPMPPAPPGVLASGGTPAVAPPPPPGLPAAALHSIQSTPADNTPAGATNPLLAAIQAGTQLRKTEQVERPVIEDDSSVLGLIAKALLDRRAAIKDEPNREEDDEDAWADDLAW